MYTKNKLIFIFLSLLILAGCSPANSQIISEKNRKKPVEDSIVDLAYSLVGSPYKQDGKTPAGFNSVNFVKYVYKHSLAKMDLPSTVTEQYKVGEPVDEKKDGGPLMGDLVFFQTNGKPTDVGIFDLSDRFNGRGFYIVTPKGVQRENLDSTQWSARYLGAKRLIQPPENVQQFLKKVFSLAKEGKVLDCEFPLGTKESVIQQKWGKPDNLLKRKKWTLEIYKKRGFELGFDAKGTLIGIKRVIQKPLITNNDIRKVLGGPDWSDGIWGYQTGPFFYYMGKENCLYLEADPTYGGDMTYALGVGRPVPEFISWDAK